MQHQQAEVGQQLARRRTARGSGTWREDGEEREDGEARHLCRRCRQAGRDCKGETRLARFKELRTESFFKPVVKMGMDGSFDAMRQRNIMRDAQHLRETVQRYSNKLLRSESRTVEERSLVDSTTVWIEVACWSEL